MKMLSLAFVAMLGLTLAGCGVKAPLEGRNDPYDSAQIHFAQKNLKKSTAVKMPVAARDPKGEILYITVPIRSTINKQLYVDYRVTWFDASGLELNSTGWMSKTLAPNTPDAVTVNSTTERATDFQVDFRWSQ